MYYEIKETKDYHWVDPEVCIEITGIKALPAALERLASQGYDLEPSLKALQEAVDEQRKRKALEAAISDLTKPAQMPEK